MFPLKWQPGSPDRPCALESHLIVLCFIARNTYNFQQRMRCFCRYTESCLRNVRFAYFFESQCFLAPISLTGRWPNAAEFVKYFKLHGWKELDKHKTFYFPALGGRKVERKTFHKNRLFKKLAWTWLVKVSPWDLVWNWATFPFGNSVQQYSKNINENKADFYIR